MSRLPRLHSSPDRYTTTKVNQNIPTMPSSITANLKRKAAGYIDTDDGEDNVNDQLEATDQPRKLPAIGANRPTAGLRNQPLRELRTKTNQVGLGVGPPPLTKPRAPQLSKSSTATSRMARATSAPPKSTGVRSVSTSSTVTRTIATRPLAGRLASGSSNLNGTEDRRFTDLQNKVSSIESARAADAAALAASMASERAKVAELQANHLTLSRELAAAKSQEMNQRKELVVASDEIADLKKRHQRELMDLEMDMKRKEREARELGDEVRVLREDLERERETVSSLKSTLSQQATAHITLTTQNNLLQAQTTALQCSVDLGTSNISSLRLELEAAQRKIEELEADAREAEGVRRKLHNMVQELKGNIRVFCRVRPVLPSDVDEEKEVEADMKFPDKRDHKEIVLTSTSESATGQERREVYNFGFDRVSYCSATFTLRWIS